MARTGLITAGFALSAVLALAASCDAAPPRASKTMVPPKAEMVTQAAVVVPKPRPNPAAGAHKTQSARTARYARHGGSLARNSRTYRYADSRPMSGPVYEAGRGQPPGTGCDEACRYRAWLKDYDAWYLAYGGRYAEYPPPPPSSAGNRDWPRTAYRPDQPDAWSARDRLDPWHGYDGHDGPQNGY